jgi:hypothetical protein
MVPIRTKIPSISVQPCTQEVRFLALWHRKELDTDGGIASSEEDERQHLTLPV